ncbi:hypothetical protein AgCh_017216 [Apium graveolens]
MEILHLGDDSRLVKMIPYPPHEDQAQINGGRIKTRQLDDETREQTENMKQIQEALATPIGATADFDEDELEAELKELESAELEEESLQPVGKAPPITGGGST